MKLLIPGVYAHCSPKSLKFGIEPAQYTEGHISIL